jgi:hypothetical protein
MHNTLTREVLSLVVAIFVSVLRRVQMRRRLESRCTSCN